MANKNRNGGSLPYDRGWAWMVVLGCFINNFFILGILGSFGMLTHEIRAYFDVPVSLAAMVMASSSFVLTFLAPVSMTLGEQYGERPVVIAGGIFGALGFALAYPFHSVEYLIAVCGVFFGIGCAMSYGNNMVMVAKYFKKRRTLANGIGLCGAGIGQLALSPLIQFLIDTYTVRGTLLIIGGLFFHISLGGCLYRPISTPKHKEDIDAEKTQSVGESSSKEMAYNVNDQKHEDATAEDDHSYCGEMYTEINGSMCLLHTNRTAAKSVQPGKNSTNHSMDDHLDYEHRPNSDQHVCDHVLNETTSQPEARLLDTNTHNRPLNTQSKHSTDIAARHSKSIMERYKILRLFDFRAVLKNYKVILLIVSNFFYMFGGFTFLQFMPMMAIDKGVTHYDKAMMISLRGVGDTVGRLAIGVLGDFNLMPRYRMVAISALSYGVNAFVFSFANTFWWMWIHGFLSGVLTGIPVTLAAPVIVDFVGIRLLPKAMGVVMLMQGLAASCGQPIFGHIRDVTGSYFAVIILISVSFFISGIVLLCYPLVERIQDKREHQHA